MPSGTVVGIDVGSTVLKAAAFDVRTAKVIAQAGKRPVLRVGADGFREQSPEGLDRAIADAMHVLRASVGRRWSGVGGIGLAAQGGSTITADRETGKVLTPMILWNDTRAAIGRVPMSARETRDRIERGYRNYGQVFEMLLGRVPSGRGLHFGNV